MTANIPKAWVPSQFLNRQGQAMVQMVDFSGRQLTSSFMRQDLEVCPRRILVSFADLMANVTVDQQALSDCVAGMIFHMSRCGSTLATQMLRQHPGYVVVSEADFLGQFLQEYRGSREDLVKHLQAMTQLFVQTLCAPGQKLIIKWSSWNAWIIDAIAEALPGVPACYMYRDPGQILVSLENSKAEWQRIELIEGRLNEQTPCFAGEPTTNPYIDLLMRAGSGEVSSTEMAARFIGLCCDAIADSDLDVLMVGYEEMPDAVFSHIVPHFSITMDGIVKSRARMETRWNTKALSKAEVYSSDTEQKKRAVTPQMQELIEDYMSSPLTRLQQISAAKFPQQSSPTEQTEKSSVIANTASEKNNKPAAANKKSVVKWL